MPGEQRRHRADLAAAHRVRLAGQREGARARAPELGRREVEVHAARSPCRCRARSGSRPSPRARARRRRPPRGRRRARSVSRGTPHSRSTRSAGEVEAARPRAPRSSRCARRARRVARRAAARELGEQAAQEHGVAARARAATCRSAASAVAVRRGSSTTSARARAPRRARALEALEQHRVAPRHVGADHQEQVRVLEVVVAGGRAVHAEGALVAGHRARHAEPRVRIDVVRAEEALRELVERVVVLGEELAREVEADRVGAAREQRARAARRRGDPVAASQLDARERRALRGARQRMRQPVRQVHRLGEREALRCRAGRGWRGAPGRRARPRCARPPTSRARRSRRRRSRRPCASRGPLAHAALRAARRASLATSSAGRASCSSRNSSRRSRSR